MKTLKQLAEDYEVYVKADNDFQRQARLMQALWREARGYRRGLHKQKPLGSRLEMPWAKDTLANYLTPTIGQVVKYEKANSGKQGKVYTEPRIYDDLLSSQPLCFNLFAELQQNLSLASIVFQNLSQGRIHTVTNIQFEYSPGRGSIRYTGDKSAFDVYVEYKNITGQCGFVGIEVKYHENLKDAPSSHKPRYDEVAEIMGCFTDTFSLREKSLQQIWRDHLLVGSLRHADKFDDGFFVFLYPKNNQNCAKAVEKYTKLLSDQNTFQAWTLEQVADVIIQHTRSEWIDAFVDRYLNFSKIDQLLQES